MDVLTVYKETKQAVKKIRSKSIPIFFEVKTYRYRGHSMSDPARYRPKEELAAYKNKDPIEILKKGLIGDKIITELDFKEMDERAKKVTESAVSFAEKSEEPSVDTLFEDIYS